MLFVLALIAVVVAFYLYSSAKKKGIKAQATFSLIGLVVAVLIAFTQLFTVIPAGHSGVIDFFGSVSDKTLGPGSKLCKSNGKRCKVRYTQTGNKRSDERSIKRRNEC